MLNMFSGCVCPSKWFLPEAGGLFFTSLQSECCCLVFFTLTLKKQEMKNVELQVRVLVTVNLPSCPVLVDEEGGKYDTAQWSHPASTSAKQV